MKYEDAFEAATEKNEQDEQPDDCLVCQGEGYEKETGRRCPFCYGTGREIAGRV